jgi:flagella basal body P-ring formation protein FlgA
MTRSMFSRLTSAAVPLAFALFASAAAANDAAPGALDDTLQLNTSISVSGPDVTLGDIFTGYLSRPEKVVAQAPRPGQRLMLTAEWLSKLAYTYGLGWQPTNGYDRAVVYQPGQPIAPQDIIAAVKADLIAKGMPANYSVTPAAPLPTITIAAAATTTIGVREAHFDANARTFSAVVEIPPGTPGAQFVSMRGAAFPVVTVPVLNQSATKTVVITAEMLTTREVPEEQMRADTVTDAALLIGKTPKGFLKAGLPVRDTEISQATLVEVPVLATDMRRDGTIAETIITFATFNAADLPADVITDAHQLVGRTPRRFLGAGMPLRRGDVQMIRQVPVPVAVRDLNRGEVINAKDITFVSMNDTDIVTNVITDEELIVGRQTKHPIRAGQTLRGFDIFRPTAVARGKLVTIVWSTAVMNLTAQGLAQEPGGIGDVIRVTNSKSKTSVMAEVIDAQTVRVTAQESFAH